MKNKIENANSTETIQNDAEVEPSARQEILALMQHHGRSLFRAAEMKIFFGDSKNLYEDCRDSDWLKPVVTSNRLVEYHLADIVACTRRLRSEGRPAPRQKLQHENTPENPPAETLLEKEPVAPSDPPPVKLRRKQPQSSAVPPEENQA